MTAPDFRLRVPFAAVLLFGLTAAGAACAQEPRGALTVHLAQANNRSPYAFVRARFEPAEVSDPWSVRFLDQEGREVPYFVWDSVTWKVAREGRADWGNRYALLNHHPGSAPEAVGLRALRLEAARRDLPELAAVLGARDEASKRSGDSVCAALYLLRRPVPPFGKAKLRLQVDPTRQAGPGVRRLEGNRVAERLDAAAGGLVLEGLPDRPAVRWRGRELFRYAGFTIGDSAVKTAHVDGDAHADPTRPFAIEITEGIITRLSIQGQTAGRAGSPMNWQCTYWLFPEGSYVALKGFSFDDTGGYLGGGLTMARWEMPARPKEVHGPDWENPWWFFQVGDGAFTAVHQFTDAPLTVGHANNPFMASTPDAVHLRHGEKTKGQGDGLLELSWSYELTDRRIYRLFHPRLDNDGTYDLAEVTDLRQTLLETGKLTRVPADAIGKDGLPLWPPGRVAALETALSFVKWRPREDWLYRQYLVGVGDSAAEAEGGLRQVLGAAAGWVDRPFAEEELAELIVRFSLRKSSRGAAALQHSWTVLPAVLEGGDRDQARMLLRACADPLDTAADAMARIRKCVAGGGAPLDGMTKDGGEGWIHNPAYAAVDVPVALRFLEHFRLFDLTPHRRQEYRRALLEWADFSLEVLGGQPLSWEKLGASYRSLWSNRLVMLLPLLLRAHRETGEEKYSRAARLLFDDVLLSQVERSPHGYFWAWGQSARKAELFDPNYNMAAHDRGIIDLWSEGELELIGRERAAGFAAAQARYLVFSAQFLDTLETDSMTAVQSHFPGGIPSGLGQVALFLHDDFPFYRGLVGDMIRWGVIDDGGTVERREGRRNFHSMKIGSRGAVFWAYGIGRDPPSRSRTAREMRERWLPAPGARDLAGGAARALKAAAVYYRSRVARHGGYVYYTGADLRERWGEGKAGPDTIFVQPPGTSTVGMAYLEAFEATGDRFHLEAAREAAEALVEGQLESGGWTQTVEFGQARRLGRYRKRKGGSWNVSSLDDGQTQAALLLLLRADRALDFQHAAIHEAALHGLNALLRAQFPSGGFPQVWTGPVGKQPVLKAKYPEYDWKTEGRIKNYWDHYTLNDGLAGTVSEVLIEAHRVYRDEIYRRALERLGDFLLLARMPEPQPGWCQQYNFEMVPIWARRFEPPAITAGEGQDVMETLLEIFRHTGEKRFLEPIPRALEYYRKGVLPDGRVARFYELRTNRPLYVDADYRLTHDDSAAPAHYGWKVPARFDAIERDFREASDGQVPGKAPSAKELEGEVRRILGDLDAEGRWVSTYAGERLTGQPEFAVGFHYLSSAVFSRNVEVLSEYLAAGESDGGGR